MSTSQAQIIANHLNAQHSTGPRSAEGKAVVARNNFRHGCAGAIFIVLDWEKQEEFDELVAGLREEHAPATPTEHLLVDKMAQSYWLSKRASYLQHMCFDSQVPMCSATEEKVFALYMRYQTTHERAFYKALNELQKLRAEKRKPKLALNRSSASRLKKSAAKPSKNAGKSCTNPPFCSPKPSSNGNFCSIWSAPTGILPNPSSLTACGWPKKPPNHPHHAWPGKFRTRTVPMGQLSNAGSNHDVKIRLRSSGGKCSIAYRSAVRGMDE